MKVYPKRYLKIIRIALFSSLISGCANKAISRVCVNSACIQAEVADSAEKQEVGLMFRKNLAENRGMLFIFDREAKYSFWMKNMQFPLDIIWIDSNREIVDITENALPCKGTCDTIMPAVSSRYVLEVSSGFVKRKKIKKGDKLRF